MLYEKWVSVLGSPVYIFTKMEGRYLCDKVYTDDGLKRLRYFLTKRRCSCMSYAKKEYCKHINMLNNNGKFLSGVPTDLVIEEVRRIQELINPLDQDWLVKTDNMPVRVETATIQVKVWPEETLSIVSIIDLEGGRFMLTLQKSKVPEISL